MIYKDKNLGMERDGRDRKSAKETCVKYCKSAGKC